MDSLSADDANVTLARLDDQIDWYDLKSRSCQRWFKSLKTVEIAAAQRFR